MQARAERDAEPDEAVANFADRLAEAVERKRSQLVVGLDPVREQLPVELQAEEPAAAFVRFCSGIVDAVAPAAVAVKPQSAFFEAIGPPGAQALRRGVRLRPRRRPARDRRRQARGHRLDRARLRGRLRRAA